MNLYMLKLKLDETDVPPGFQLFDCLPAQPKNENIELADVLLKPNPKKGKQFSIFR